MLRCSVLNSTAFGGIFSTAFAMSGGPYKAGEKHHPGFFADRLRRVPAAFPRKDTMVLPQRQGLYDPANEHDACGVGFVAHIKNQKSHSIIEQGLLILENLEHRGATGYDPLLGDGAGILIQIPDGLFRTELAD